MEPALPVASARSARILHAALVIGSILVPAGVAALAVVTLITLRPSPLVGDGGT